MALPTPQNINFDHSAFYEIQGNLYNYHDTSPGERGIYELFRASCPDAFHDSRARNPPPRCLEGTRVDILKEIFDWIEQADERILWLSGPAGAGKSAIAQTVAETCAEISTLGASFFFFRGASGRNTEEQLIASIAYHLVTRMPEKRVQLGQIIEEDLSILHKPPHVQIQKLIIPLFTLTSSHNAVAIGSSFPHSPSVLIIDGLDECQGDNNQRDIVECIGELVSATSVPLCCIIVSRPEPQIEESFGRLSLKVHHISLANMHHLEQAEDDICTYLRSAFNQIYQDHSLNVEGFWPREDDVSSLVRNSEGIFIYASTVIKYVEDRDFDPVERLRDILVPSLGDMAFVDLDQLYRHILGTHKNKELLLRIFTVVCLWGDTSTTAINSDDIERLLQLRKGAATIALRRMRSILNINTLRFYHKSFTDFIGNKDRAQEFFIDFKRGHASMAQMLLRYISQHTEMDNLFWHAQNFWAWHCQESGRWDENPYLLKEISEARDFCVHHRRQYAVHYAFQRAQFLPWLNVDKIQPVDLEYHPLDIQYRLFKVYWRQMQTIFTFYDDSGMEGLMKGRIRSGLDNEVLSQYQGRNFVYCWVITKNQEPSPVDANENLIHSLAERRLQRNKKSDSTRFIDGHAKVVDRCLEVISLDRGTDHAEADAACSYARKYLRQHLSHVPPGNRVILDSLKEYECSKLRHRLPADDIQAIQAWLKSSRIEPEMIPEVAAMGWFGQLGIMHCERDTQKAEISEIVPKRSSFGMAASTWFESRISTPLYTTMPFERDVQKVGKSDLNPPWSSFGMAVAVL